MFSQRNNKGFTLIELISVIVVLSILATFSTTFIIDATRNFVAISDKTTLLADSRLTTEYMIRKLRLSLPHSVRVTNSERCLQYLPIIASGKYLKELPSLANGASASGNIPAINVSPYTVSSNAKNLVVGVAASSELYGTTTASLASVQSMTATSITLNINKQWLRNSINQRFYLTANPSAFCLIDNEMRFYRSLSLAEENVDLTSAYDLLAQSVRPLNVLFSVSESTESRNVLINLSLRFFRGDTQLDTVKQVVIRNVP